MSKPSVRRRAARVRPYLAARTSRPEAVREAVPTARPTSDTDLLSRVLLGLRSLPVEIPIGSVEVVGS